MDFIFVWHYAMDVQHGQHAINLHGPCWQFSMNCVVETTFVREGDGSGHWCGGGSMAPFGLDGAESATKLHAQRRSRVKAASLSVVRRRIEGSLVWNRGLSTVSLSPLSDERLLFFNHARARGGSSDKSRRAVGELMRKLDFIRLSALVLLCFISQK